MLLRISQERAGESTTVHVAGRLEGAGVDELDRTCRAAAGKLVIDLSALFGADQVGLALLRSLRASGATLVGTTPFVQLLLDGEGTTERKKTTPERSRKG